MGRLGSARRSSLAPASVCEDERVEELPVLTSPGAFVALAIISILVAMHSE